MNEMIRKSVVETYRALYGKHDQELKNFFVAIVQVNDEVTFIINKGSNKFERKIIKIITIISGLLSFWTTNYLLKNQDSSKPKLTEVEYYDARPLIMNNQEEVFNYIKYRYWTARKHGQAKTLKFNGLNLKPNVWENVNSSSVKLKDHDLYSEYYHLESTFKVYIPDLKYNLCERTLTEKYIDSILNEELTNAIKKHSDSEKNNLKRRESISVLENA